ncbi:MAG: YgiQ family radical SAM protein [Clostridia bacterium]|nr:YgiQ family radical SAM protein [Clostridia bacterium]
MAFLPINRADMSERGWQECDFVLVTGDAYVDHPSFGTAVISRVLENAGYRVSILSQPQNDGDYRRFGTPRLGFLVNSGNIDSMVAHYTAAKKKRSDDAYTPGGRAGARPDRALTVYSRTVRRLFPAAFIAVGGLEASLRRFAHYDYWADTVMPTVLLDTEADLLMYGMGEKHVVELARRLEGGERPTDIRGTCVFSETPPTGENVITLPSFEAVRDPSRQGKRAYAEACRIQQDEHDAVRAKTLVQEHDGIFLVQNPPMPPLSTAEMDAVYALPFERTYHPSYEARGGVPGIEEVQFSIIHNRGCFGACNFCSLAFHQGRTISSRSHASVIAEAKKITEMPSFKGYIHDVGGPTANFRKSACRAQSRRGVCPGKKCLAPTPCKALEVDHSDYLALLRKLRALPKVKKVFIRSGVRFDYLMLDKNPAFFRELVKHHVSGQLKVAPEHCSDRVLSYMGKPSIQVYENFKRRFEKETERISKKQYLVPYLMSSHPGSRAEDAIALAEFLKKEKMHPQQVQDFYPTPGTVSTCMFYTGLDPHTMQPVYVPKTPEEKAEQRALLQYFKRENFPLVRAALRRAERDDLIGTHRGALVPPEFPSTPCSQRTPRTKAKPPAKKKNSAARAAAKQRAKRQKKG